MPRQACRHVEVMRQEQLGQVVAHHAGLVAHGVIDPGASAIDEQGPGPGDQAGETGQGQRDQGQAGQEVAASEDTSEGGDSRTSVPAHVGEFEPPSRLASRAALPSRDGGRWGDGIDDRPARIPWIRPK